MSRESLIVVESVLQSPNVTRIPFHRSPIVVEFARESRSSSNPPSRANSVGNHRANPPVSHESQSSTRSRLRNRWGTTARIPDVTRIPDRRRIHRRVRNPNGNPPCAPPMSRESLIVVEFAVAQWESMGNPSGIHRANLPGYSNLQAGHKPLPTSFALSHGFVCLNFPFTFSSVLVCSSMFSCGFALVCSCCFICSRHRLVLSRCGFGAPFLSNLGILLWSPQCLCGVKCGFFVAGSRWASCHPPRRCPLGLMDKALDL